MRRDHHVGNVELQRCECSAGPGLNDCPSDLNSNGLVEVTDLLMLLGDFGLECEVSPPIQLSMKMIAMQAISKMRIIITLAILGMITLAARAQMIDVTYEVDTIFGPGAG